MSEQRIALTSDLPETLAEAARLIRARALSPVELTDAMLARIERIEPAVHAHITVTAEHARAQARRAMDEIAQGRYRGTLHGIPFGVKDNYETAGIRTTGHSRAYRDHVPASDAFVIDRLYAGGAVLVGKHVLHELAHGGPSFDLPWPPARNPWHTEHFTGGSSSGSGSAVAAGLGYFSLGSDTGGSIRTPAALCGLVGMKPTFGLVSRRGVIPNCYSLDTCGPLAKSVEDCALVLDVLAAHDPGDPACARGAREDFRRALRTDLKDVSVGVLRHFWEEDLAADAELGAATDEALRVLKNLGARLEEVRLRTPREYYDVWTLIEEPETFSIQRQALQSRPGDFGSVFLERTLIACLMDGADHVDAHRVRARMVAEMRALMARHDVLVMAGAGPAPRLSPALATWPAPNRFQASNITGDPAIVVPAGFSRAGLPLSIHFIGRPFEDAKLLDFAHAYEQATQWRRKRSIESVAIAPEIVRKPEVPTTKGIEQRLLDTCTLAASRAGLRLDDAQLAVLCRAAPHVFEMAARVREAARHAGDLASVFSPR
jgi:aspartyl-tRNA(Asn)/glutamyl-tRNA(Gln) amidotransferase subunit A